ncbi:MAG: S1C family serine protease, partial [Chloroflexota bacterium]
MHALDRGDASSADDEYQFAGSSTQGSSNPTFQLGSPGPVPPANPAGFEGSKTQRLGPRAGGRGVSPNIVVGVAALSLALGGAAGAGAGAVVVHYEGGSKDAAGTRGSPAAFAAGSGSLGAVDSLAVRAAGMAGPAVVSILNNQQPQVSFFGATQSTSAGSGLIIAKNGYILTNYHVVAQERNLKVTFANGISTSATLVGGDPTNDIAVIKVNVPVPAVAVFGDSKKVRPGETVIAIGNALGDLQNTVTEGIISGLRRA